jgi:hypothetical protein
MRLSPANFPTFGTTIGWTAPTNLDSENTGFLQFFFYRFKESTKPQLPHQEANKNPQDPCDFPPHNHQTAWNSKMISGDLSGSSPGPKGNVSASKNTRRS